MRKMMLAMTLVLFTSVAAGAETIKLGVMFGYTGPIESLTPGMAKGAELAIKEVNDSGALLGGAKVVSVRGDTTCTDSAGGQGSGRASGHLR